MSKGCIVIIDPQKDFTSRQGAYAQRHAGINQVEQSLDNIRSLLAKQKDHSVIIIYSDYSKGQFGEQLSMCIPGTEGHLIDIQPDQPFVSFSKSQHSAFSSSAFSSYVEQSGFERLLLCGFLVLSSFGNKFSHKDTKITKYLSSTIFSLCLCGRLFKVRHYQNCRLKGRPQNLVLPI
jgi:isochorismate hydrolase